MFFVSSEERKRSKAFDRCREATNRVLQDPEIARQLGEFTNKLIQTNNSLYLPNKKHGEFFTPDHLRDNPDAVACLPFFDKERDHIERLSASVLANFVKCGDLPSSDHTPPLRGTVVPMAEFKSSTVDIPAKLAENMGTTVVDQYFAEESSSLLTADSLLKRGYPACVRRDHLLRDNSKYFSSRLVTYISTSSLDKDDYKLATTSVHELMHVVDYQENPITMKTRLGRVASEFAAHHAQQTIESKCSVTESFAEIVDQLRQIHASEDNFYPVVTPQVADHYYKYESRLRQNS